MRFVSFPPSYVIKPDVREQELEPEVSCPLLLYLECSFYQAFAFFKQKFSEKGKKVLVTPFVA